jgi:Tfp pilus assembly protein PilV
MRLWSVDSQKVRDQVEQMKDEGGSVLVEVLVSSILLVLVAVGVFGAFDAANRSTAEQRHEARANSFAQADLARMRTMRISDLSNLSETNVVTADGIPYTVKSTATFEDEEGTVSSCGEETTADYIQIRSTVTWPGIRKNSDGDPLAVVAQSLVAPPNGSVSPDTGALVVQIEGAGGVGVPDVELELTGNGEEEFSATGSSGCAIFGNLPEGNYTLEVSPPPGGELVDGNGNPPKPQPASVVAEGTNTLALQYDEPGGIPVSFVTRVEAGAEPTPSEADSVVVFNTGMTVPRAFGTPGVPASVVTATSLFPFSSTYAVYAGTCAANNPNPGEALDPPPPAIAAIVVLPGESPGATIELPALRLTVWSGAGEGEPGSPVPDAEVELVDMTCVQVIEEEEEGGGGEVEVGDPVVRTATTNAAGKLDDPGLPFGVHDVCVSGEVDIDDVTQVVHVSTVEPVKVPTDPEAMEAGAVLNIYLGHEDAEPGECP